MTNNRYTVSSPQEAVEALEESRLPMIRSEREQLAQSLWDAAFNEGVRQARLAAAEHTHQRLKTLHERALPNTVVSQKQLLGHLVSVFDPNDTIDTYQYVGEYREPTEVIRERLAEKARELAKRAEADPRLYSD